MPIGEIPASALDLNFERDKTGDVGKFRPRRECKHIASVMNYKCVCISLVSSFSSLDPPGKTIRTFNCREDFLALVETPCSREYLFSSLILCRIHGG